MKRIFVSFCFMLAITGSLIYASPQQSNQEDKILHKTLDELTTEFGKPVNEETIWGGGVATFKVSDSLYYSCIFMYPDNKCHQYVASDSNPFANHVNLNAGAISSELFKNALMGDTVESKTTDTAGWGTWDLNGREIADFPRPAYNGIQEEGRVVVTITVDPNGKVIDTRINNRTNTSNQQLRNTAIEAARRTTFNSIGGSSNQTGTITYYFRLK